MSLVTLTEGMAICCGSTATFGELQTIIIILFSYKASQEPYASVKCNQKTFLSGTVRSDGPRSKYTKFLKSVCCELNGSNEVVIKGRQIRE